MNALQQRVETLGLAPSIGSVAPEDPAPRRACPNFSTAGRGARLALLAAALCLTACAAAVADDLSQAPSWTSPATESVRDQVAKWLDGQESLDDAQRQAAMERWQGEENPAISSATLLDRLAETLALADENVAQLIEDCTQPYQETSLPEAPWLLEGDDARADFVSHNMRLYFGRWLAQHRLFEEALVQIADLTPEQVVDPASLLFYQAVSHQRVVNVEQSQQALAKLLERENELPRRYRDLAVLMREDLSGVEPDSLDHIARRMDDVQRRLDLGFADKKVRLIEDGVVESLDKLIEELEEQAQQQQQQQQAGSQGQPSGQPMQDSRIARQQGPGEVQPRDIGDEAGWGSLPPKQREEAMQQLGRDFPSHYRDVIQQYFKRLAAGESSSQAEP
ncbi:MAG: hypothetical protein WDZ59_00910 [Pirellulales bacterium]